MNAVKTANKAGDDDMVNDGYSLDEEFLTQKARVRKLEKKAARMALKSEVGRIIKGRTRQRAIAVLDAFETKYAWTILDIFLHATHLATDGKKTRMRSKKVIILLVEQILKRFEEFIQNHTMEPNQPPDFPVGVPEEFLAELYQFLGERPSKNL